MAAPGIALGGDALRPETRRPAGLWIPRYTDLVCLLAAWPDQPPPQPALGALAPACATAAGRVLLADPHPGRPQPAQASGAAVLKRLRSSASCGMNSSSASASADTPATTRRSQRPSLSIQMSSPPSPSRSMRSPHPRTSMRLVARLIGRAAELSQAAHLTGLMTGPNSAGQTAAVGGRSDRSLDRTRRVAPFRFDAAGVPSAADVSARRFGGPGPAERPPAPSAACRPGRLAMGSSVTSDRAAVPRESPRGSAAPARQISLMWNVQGTRLGASSPMDRWRPSSAALRGKQRPSAAPCHPAVRRPTSRHRDPALIGALWSMATSVPGAQQRAIRTHGRLSSRYAAARPPRKLGPESRAA